MSKAAKVKLTAAQERVLNILKEGGELVRVSGKFGGWCLDDKDGNNQPIHSATAWKVSGMWELLDADRKQFGVTRYRYKSTTPAAKERE